ncbi:MAG: DUF349 domain-containing protein [Bacteroidota bacterium]|nr:DUF349 domain-containing protein [Bacteroidota bacterium]
MTEKDNPSDELNQKAREQTPFTEDTPEKESKPEAKAREHAPLTEEAPEKAREHAPLTEEAPEKTREQAPLSEEAPEKTREQAPLTEEAPEKTREHAPLTEEAPEKTREQAPLTEEAPEAKTREQAPLSGEAPEAKTREHAPLSGTDDLPALGVDYSEYAKEQLVDALKHLLERRPIQEIRNDVENIKSVFYKKHHQIADEKKADFIAKGGAKEEFRLPPDPLEDQYKELYDGYRQRRIEYNKILELQKFENLARKKDIIEKIKNLVHSQESLNKTFNDFRDLQYAWRDAGPVPQGDLASLWENYHHHVEKFYDFIKINKELRDLDLRKNLEIKIKLCESAEELLLVPNVVKAFRSLQELHGRWREVGPVSLDKKEEVWIRFKESTTLINKKHQDHFHGLKEEQKENLEAKIRLCEQVEEIISLNIDSPRKWNEFSQKVIDLQKMWRSIGFAPKKDNNQVYEKFRNICDEFFNKKRDFFSRHRDAQKANLQLKTELCIQAEALSNNTDWRQTTEDLISIQKQWKKIGPVPRKYSDDLWHRFRTACDTFFNSKKDHFKGQDSDQGANLTKKLELIELVKAFTLTDNQNSDLEKLKQFQKEFTIIGHVPVNQKNKVHKEFRELINQLFDKLNIDESRREIMQFRQKIDTLAQSPKNKSRIYVEREKLLSKLKQLEGDVILWENNIGFFAKSKNSEVMIKEVRKKIEMSKKQIDTLKERIDIVDNI